MTRLLAALLLAGCAATDPGQCTSLECLKAQAAQARAAAAEQAICQRVLARSACTKAMSCEVHVQVKGGSLVCRW